MYIHIGQAIKECREKKGWSKQQLAMYAHVDKKTVTRIENTGHGNIESVETFLGVMGYELEVVSREYRKHYQGDPRD